MAKKAKVYNNSPSQLTADQMLGSPGRPHGRVTADVYTLPKQAAMNQAAPMISSALSHCTHVFPYCPREQREGVMLSCISIAGGQTAAAELGVLTCTVPLSSQGADA